MAITHDDLSIRNYRAANYINSRLAIFLIGFSVLCGLTGFILCLAGEASRSQVTWMIMTIQDSKGYRCSYSGSGKAALILAVAAFFLFAVAMFTEHAYMLVAATSPSTPAFVVWPAANHPTAVSPAAITPARQACVLFLIAWICFAIAEILLIIAIGVESGHLYDWTKPRLTCPEVRPGLYATAGVFGLATVFLGVALYLTTLRTQRLQQEENMGRIQHLQPTAPPQEPSAMRAYQSRASGDISSLNKTSTSV